MSDNLQRYDTLSYIRSESSKSLRGSFNFNRALTMVNYFKSLFKRKPKVNLHDYERYEIARCGSFSIPMPKEFGLEYLRSTLGAEAYLLNESLARSRITRDKSRVSLAVL